MIETLTQAFLFALADGKKLSKGESLTVTSSHGLSIWVNETSLRNKISLGMKNSGRNFMEILQDIPQMAAHCLHSNLNGQKIPNEVFNLIVYGFQASQVGLQSVPKPKAKQRPKESRAGSQIKDFERLWKAPIHGRDEQADKTNFIDYALLNEIYQEMASKFTLDQSKALRGAWVELRQGIEWGEIQRKVELIHSDPTASDYMAYFSELAKIMINRGKICEADFRHRGKGQAGLLWPFDEIRIKAVLLSKKPIQNKIEPEKKSREERLEALKIVQEKHGWYKDSSGRMRHKNW